MKKGRKAMAIMAVFIAATLATLPIAASMTENTNVPDGNNANTYSGTTTVTNALGNLVVGTSDDEYEPKIEADANGNLLVKYTVELGVFDTDVLLASSTNGGSSWSSVTPPWGALEGRQSSGGLIYAPNGGMIIGTFADHTSGWHMYYKVSDVSNLETYDYNGWGGFEEITSATVTYTTFEDGTKAIVNPLTGTSSGFEGTCMWEYADMDEMAGLGGVYYYDAQSRTGAYTEARNMEGYAFTGNHYGFVVDAFREETGVRQPLIKWTYYEEEPDLEYTDHQFWMEDGDVVAADPDAYGSGNNIFVVYEFFNPTFGDYDIKCKYSNDGGGTWKESMAASESLVDERHPAVYASGNTVYCVYVKQGNLYLVESEDGGATWGTPEQINEVDGTVVSEDGTADISKGGIVWTDNRDGQKDIYYAPLPAPIINVESIAGGMGITATVTNTGTVDATNVPWSIDVSGLVFLGGHTEGTIDLPAGGEATVSSGLVFGIGPGTITVTASGASKAASCFVLGPLVLGV